MPACEPWCPLVKIQLKKLVAEAPWILDKDRTTISSKTRDSATGIDDEKFISARLAVKDKDLLTDLKEADLEKADLEKADLEKADLKEKDLQTPIETDLDHRSREIDVQVADLPDTASVTRKESPSKSQIAVTSKDRVKSATQWSTISKESDKMVEADISEEPELEKSASRTSEREKQKTLDKPSSKLDAVGEKEEDLVSKRPEDDCDLSCIRHTSRSCDYFENVCTCTFSCVVRCLVVDSFIRSLLTSAALFALGLKLCSELDAWYLPTRNP